MTEMEPKKWVGCRDFPEHLTDEILAWLPVECLCRFRSVCKQWNSLISSSRFITKWAEAPPNRNPWLVFQIAKSEMPNCLAYCFFTGAWKKTSSVSLSFLLQQQENAKGVLDCCGSAAGLFLVRNYRRFYTVCNPLTRTYLKLPPVSSIRSVSSTGIVEGGEDSPHTYKVVAVGRQRGQKVLTVEIYDSAEKSWRIAGHLPEDVHRVGRVGEMGMEMVFCDGSFYCLTVSTVGWRWGIMGFSIRDGTFVYAQLPEMANEKTICPYLLTCSSRVLFVGVIIKDWEELLQEVIIWELDSSSSSSSTSLRWKEIARMPPPLCRTLFDIDWPIELPFMCCIGVGPCACFIVKGGLRVMKVVFYSVSEKTWSWLPSCPFDENTAIKARVMAFEPRLDMKVG